MGRIKTTLIKRTGNSVVEEYSDKLSESFDENKAMVSKLVSASSKKMRNIIAGHVTREMKKKQE